MRKINLIFLLNIRKAAMVFILWIVSVLMHNIASWILRFEEPLFFIVAFLVIPLYLIIALGYTAIAFLIIEKSILAK